MAEALCRLRLSAGDLAQLLLNQRDVGVRFAASHFEVHYRFRIFNIVAKIYPEATPHRVRFVVPFGEISVDKGAGLFVRGVLALVWNWLESALDRKVADTLAAKGLPWDLATVDDVTGDRGRAVVLNVHMTVLNQYLKEKDVARGLPVQVKSLEVKPDGLDVVLDLGTPAR